MDSPTLTAAPPPPSAAPSPMTGGYELPVFDFRTPPELQSPRPAGTPARYPLVIVGGGLAGLTLAADLSVRGVPCVLLDEDDTVGVRGASSRGIVYVERTLEICERLGIFERMHAKGVRWSAGKVLAGDEVLYGFDYQPASVSRQPPFINLQQFYLEWFLVDRIQTLGVAELRWKHRVTGVAAHDDHTDLTVDTPAGSYTLQAGWVVDAEGVNSIVRQQLGLEVATERGQDRWCITDVRFRHARVNERWTWVEAPFNEHRGVWQHLMADDVWRLDFQMAPDADPAYVSRPDVARERVAAMLGPDVPFELVWVGPYSYRTQLMSRFIHRRVIFIGDAAHAKSPFGARGGNSGIMDADNLGWKLALVLQGRAGEALLHSYHCERHRAAQENIRITARSGRFMQPRSEAERLLRTAVLGLAREHAFARTLLNTGRLCAPHHYGGLPTVGPGAEAGRALPNVTLQRHGHPLGLIDLLRESGESLLVLCTNPGVPAALADTLADLPARVLPLALQGTAAGEVSIHDANGHLARLAGLAPGGCCIVRPDSHLAATLAGSDAATVRAAVRRALAQTEPPLEEHTS